MATEQDADLHHAPGFREVPHQQGGAYPASRGLVRLKRDNGV